MPQELLHSNAEKRHSVCSKNSIKCRHINTQLNPCQVMWGLTQSNNKKNKTKILTFLQRVTQLCSSFFITLKLEATVVMVTTSLNINAFHQVALASELSPFLASSVSLSIPSFFISLTHTHTQNTHPKSNHHFLHKSLLSLLSGDSPQRINQRNWNSWLHHFTPHPGLRDCV